MNERIVAAPGEWLLFVKSYIVSSVGSITAKVAYRWRSRRRKVPGEWVLLWSKYSIWVKLPVVVIGTELFLVEYFTKNPETVLGILITPDLIWGVIVAWYIIRLAVFTFWPKTIIRFNEWWLGHLMRPGIRLSVYTVSAYFFTAVIVPSAGG